MAKKSTKTKPAKKPDAEVVNQVVAEQAVSPEKVELPRPPAVGTPGSIAPTMDSVLDRVVKEAVAWGGGARIVLRSEGDITAVMSALQNASASVVVTINPSLGVRAVWRKR